MPLNFQFANVNYPNYIESCQKRNSKEIHNNNLCIVVVLTFCVIAFKETQYPDAAVREQLARKLHLPETRIQVSKYQICT